jgi:homoserine dehydrogenase
MPRNLSMLPLLYNLLLLPTLTLAFLTSQNNVVWPRTEGCNGGTTSSTSLEATRRLGIFGGGTVGGGIVEILQKKQAYLKELTGSDIEIVAMCVRDLNKKRDFPIPEGCTLTDKYDDILSDDTIDLVVEVMGGTDDARDIVYNSLKAGKDVVTANKALIAKYLPEIEDILAKVNENREEKVEFRYEAAVCGGIPVIRSMQSDFVGDDVSMLSGIINGCTNFMLTAMDQGGLSYEAALAEASKLGYAEADPTLDVGGFDARSKLRILMRLAMGVEVDEDEISCRGITDLTKLDFEYAKMMGGTIKLIGVAKTVSDNKVAAFVSPCYVTGEDTVRKRRREASQRHRCLPILTHMFVCLQSARFGQWSYQCRRSDFLQLGFVHLHWTRCWTLPNRQLLCE